ncbi:uncharacterized protein [Fopius arisanus]|uniref:Uncharacterized protein n=1 Tax=Fopius arisanus TaxID=64838 RepID=A0A9R1U305_9HYME|nr:PREDICTED: uncharacterized protein LOC105268086 [Fopius arisanus]XP_011305664.1 PREDICTED: uncharacterized protein LOC105268086 [Fopius arisanus]
MRRQSFCQSLSIGNEPQIIVEESALGEEEADRRRTESPPRCLDPDSPSLNPYLLSPFREALRKHSLPTLQCTSGITASQVRRLSERGGGASGPTPREAEFLATLSQAPAPQPGGRRHSVVTISKVPPTLFGRGRRESIAAVPMGATRILPSRRDSASGVIGPPSNSGSSHNLELDIMDDITDIKARKVRLKMWRTTSHERMCEVQPVVGPYQRYTQHSRRHSDLPPPLPPTAPRRRASEVPPRCPQSPGIVCSNTDLISILSSLTSSATEINRCGDDPPRSDLPIHESKPLADRRRLKDRSNSFDISILQGTDLRASDDGSIPPYQGSSSWFVNRHQPMWKKQKSSDEFRRNFLGINGNKGVPSGEGHSFLWDNTSGTEIDAQAFGNAIQKFLTAQRNEGDRAKGRGKGKGWLPGGRGETSEGCETSICSSLKDLFVK